MARLSLDEATSRLESRANASGFDYVNMFMLKNDKDHNIVKFLLNGMADIEVYSIHEVKMISKGGVPYRVQVGCLGDNCPLCREAQKYKDQMFPLVSRARDNIYLPVVRLYDKDMSKSPAFEVWVRSTKFYRDSFAAVISRYGLDNCYEIVRNGAKGSKQVVYNMFPIPNGKDFEDSDISFADISVDQLKKDFNVTPTTIFGGRGSLIKDWSADDFAEFLETGTYPKGDSIFTDATEEEEVKPRKRSSDKGF